MSLGSSDMAGSALGTAFSLLLLASIIQGLQDVEVFHNKKMEAVVGQNVTLPCIVKNSTNLQLVNIEWSKNKKNKTKLVVYSPQFGHHLSWPNVTIQIENKLMGSYLHLSGVAKWDSGLYVCEIATFPLGSLRSETELEIKDDVELTCDVDSAVEVHTGENVTIHCSVLPNAEYSWTKNKTLLSGNESLALWRVTDAHTGVYTLTVNTGNRSLHKDFIITVLKATTSLRTDLTTVSPRSNLTEEGMIESADSGRKSSPTAGPSTTDTSVTGADVTDDNPNPSDVTTSFTNQTHSSVTTSPATHADPSHDLKIPSDQEINPTHILNTSTYSDQPVTSNQSTTLSYGSTLFRSIQTTTNGSVGVIKESPGNPSATPTAMMVREDEDTDGAQSPLLLVLIIVLMLVLIAVAGFLYRRHVRKRMDLPPPFKPPPPPVKYTAARHQVISTQPFPTSRCNSVIELKDMKPIVI